MPRKTERRGALARGRGVLFPSRVHTPSTPPLKNAPPPRPPPSGRPSTGSPIQWPQRCRPWLVFVWSECACVRSKEESEATSEQALTSCCALLSLRQWLALPAPRHSHRSPPMPRTMPTRRLVAPALLLAALAALAAAPQPTTAAAAPLLFSSPASLLRRAAGALGVGGAPPLAPGVAVVAAAISADELASQVRVGREREREREETGAEKGSAARHSPHPLNLNHPFLSHFSLSPIIRSRPWPPSPPPRPAPPA